MLQADSIYQLSDDAELWEAIAAIQVLQAIEREQSWHVLAECSEETKVSLLQSVANIACVSSGIETARPRVRFDFPRAVYDLDRGANGSYADVLARAVSGISDILAPAWPNVQSTIGGGIVVCPFPIRAELALPAAMWFNAVRHLRSYGLPVSLLANRNQRLDVGGFAEYENYSNKPILTKMQVLASADLVVGVPNEYTWAATGWQKKVVYFYPDHLPPRKWFGMSHQNFTRLSYATNMLQVPIMITGLRRAIEML